MYVNQLVLQLLLPCFLSLRMQTSTLLARFNTALWSSYQCTRLLLAWVYPQSKVECHADGGRYLSVRVMLLYQNAVMQNTTKVKYAEQSVCRLQTVGVCSCSSVSAARRNHDVSFDCSLLTCSLDVVVYLAHYQASYSLGAHSTVSCSSRRPFGLQTIGMAGENQARFPTCTCTC